MNKQHQSLYPFAKSSLALLLFLLAGVALATAVTPQQNQVHAASKSIRPNIQLFQAPYSEEMAWDLFTADALVQTRLSEIEYDFIQAVPLAHGEASR